MRTVLRSFLDSEDIFLLLRVFAFLSTCAMPTVEGELSKVQKTVLEFFSGIPPVEDESIMTAVFQQLLTIIAKAAGCVYPPNQGEAKADSGDTVAPRVGKGRVTKMSEQIPSPKHFPVAVRAAHVLVKLFVGDASEHTRATVFGDCLSVLHSAIMIKYVTFHTDLWRVATKAYVEVVKHGVPTLHDSGVFGDAESEQISLCWKTLCTSMSSILLHDRCSLPKLSPADIKAEAELDVAMVECLSDCLIPWTGSDAAVHKTVVDILCGGAQQYCHEREAFGEACYAALFRLCGRGGEADGAHSNNIAVATISFPVIVEAAKNVLHRFVDDDRKAGRMPLPRTRLAEVSTVLQQLIALDLDPRLRLEQEGKQTKSESAKRHLLMLFPLLCDCITTREDGFKQLLRDIFHMVAKEMDLE
eukprot:TRINITY_DN11567_c0_g1_i1.p1 TRINITY_DN11567_c0_g1~~TRINITY_DN11567_c0_g1_i1.p1  ORF type:complete len:473 (-),score=110.19 TRINITY_DN11567_c0_g1_i1:63-1307(-)